MHILMLVVIAGLCGLIGGQLMGARRMNVLLAIVLGFIGALAGKLIANYFHLPPLWELNFGGESFPVIWAVIGSVIVVGIYTFFSQH